MTDKEEKIHPRLLMLSDFDGEIDGRLKFHKSLYQYREAELDEKSWAFIREERGPLDPGFSSVMQSYEDLGLAEVEEDEEPHRFRITKKGRRVIDGIKTGLRKLDPSFSEKRETISKIASRNKHRSGSEIEEDEDIQEAKEEPYQTEV